MDEFFPYSPTKQKEPLTWVEVSGKTKALHKAAIIIKKALRFRKAFLGAKFANKAEPATLNRATGVVLVMLGVAILAVNYL
jgi:hypothetical protein